MSSFNSQRSKAKAVKKSVEERDRLLSIVFSIALFFLFFMFSTSNLFAGKMLVGLMIFLSTSFCLALRGETAQITYWFHYTCGMLVLIIPGLTSPYLGVGINVLWLLLLISKTGNKAMPTQVTIRGEEAATQAPVAEFQRQIAAADSGFFWAAMQMPLKYATRNNMVVGTVGSGKTLTIDMFMASVLREVAPGQNRRALIFDPKGENLSTIKGCAPYAPIYILNPFDQRCVAWDMAHDITNPADAQTFAEIMIPANHQEKDPFWRDTVLSLMEGLVIWFILHAPGVWNLRDIVLIMQNELMLRSVLSSDQRTENYLNTLGSQNTSANIFSTLSVKLRPYGLVAACWQRATQKISLSEWINTPSILLLGESETAPVPVRAINQLIFTRVAQLLLNLPEQNQNTHAVSTFIIMDELPALGKLDRLKTLATKGRSKGVSITIGFQDLEDMQHVYGKEIANTILGQCNNKAFLRLSSSYTAQWVCDLFGEYEFLDRSTGQSTSSGNKGNSQNNSENWSRANRKVVMPIELTSMAAPDARLEIGLQGFYHVQGKAFRETIPWPDLKQYLPQRDTSVPDFVERSPADYWIDPLTPADLARLNLSWLADEIFDESPPSPLPPPKPRPPVQPRPPAR
ncbi:type IV secretion system DNA-binding domain-containing protein [Nodosilinea sp. LEGE 07298]|uniref:type IV secretory system conjugative DNA transfer family protein n=1 Tax=Nodosilinea sp. LEGE 07298 TaxID=2777970 RepID=UPI00188206E4|nr:type IV secretion system DNA-binding domain-containing protein [Nodosilinea sp. LEGE 07298]MBE9110669.1 type IV secretion system DNA-binding domain-containing protein [Nodosilinea sp. LEGE 07298]